MHDFQILNLIRYLVIQWSKNDTAKFSKNFPVLVLWSVITEVYPEMAAILKESPNSLTKMAFIVNYLDAFEDLHNIMAQFTKPIPGKHIALAENKIIPHNRIYNPSLSDQKRSDILIGPLIIHGLDYVNKNQEAFCLLKETAKLYSIQDKNPNNSDLSQALEDNYGDLTETLSHLIYHSGLIA